MHKGNTKARFKEESLDMGVFDSIRERLLPLLQEAVDPLKILLQMAGDCKRGAEELLGIAEKTTPDALLLKMEQALQLPDFVFKVRQKYRAVIIDEFQDTDKVQWNIFKTLFLCAEYTVDTFCVVGDPKQSIYGFRNADIYTYLEAASHMGKESMKCLTTNYRSDTSLVTALNRLLSTKHLPGWMTLPSQGMSLDIAEVSSVHPSEPGEKGSLHFFIAEGRCMRDKWPTEQVEEECFFPFIATEIARLSSEGVANPSIPYKEMAVLVRDRYQAERLHGYLEKAGIPSAVRQGARIALSIGYLASLQLLQAVQDPHDISVLKSVLGGPLIGWTAEQLRDEAAVAKEKERFILYKEQCQSQGCGPLFQEFLSLQLDLKLRLELRQIAELLLERKTKADLTSCIQFLQEIRQSDPDEFLYRIEADEQSVPILTIHMSKGLEFEIIFALGVASRTTSKQEIIRVRDNLTLFEEEKKECREALLEQDAEKMRQLYVALTRAKNRVYIPLAFDLDERPPDLGKASPIELFCSHLYAHHTKEKMAKPSLKHLLPLLDEIRSECHITYEILTPQQEIPSLSVPRTSFATCAEPPPVHLCIPREQILSFSSLTSKGDIPKRIQIEIPSRALEIEKNPHTMPLGVETGSLIHGILEKLFLQGLHHPLQMARIASLIQQEVRLSSLQGWEEVITQMVKSVVEMPLPLMPKHTQNLVSGQPRGFGAACLKEVAREKMLQEMEFLFPYEGSLMKGFADLIFEYNHRYYLLDWKTNYLGATDADYTVENIEKAMLEHNYFLQASIYSQALQRYVKLFDTRPFSECFGGAIYLFLRGKTAYHFLPDGDICCYTQKT
jgi:exodeoxyribonuclease V beta subunit